MLCQMLCQLPAQNNTPSKQLRKRSYFYAVFDSASLKHYRAMSTIINQETRDGGEEHIGGEKRDRREARKREGKRERERWAEKT